MSDDQTMGFTSEDDLDDFRHELDGYRPDAPNTEVPSYALSDCASTAEGNHSIGSHVLTGTNTSPKKS
jgi:hypothetical protein